MISVTISLVSSHPFNGTIILATDVLIPDNL